MMSGDHLYLVEAEPDVLEALRRRELSLFDAWRAEPPGSRRCDELWRAWFNAFNAWRSESERRAAMRLSR